MKVFWSMAAMFFWFMFSHWSFKIEMSLEAAFQVEGHSDEYPDWRWENLPLVEVILNGHVSLNLNSMTHNDKVKCAYLSKI